MFLPFALIDGLCLAEIFPVPFDSVSLPFSGDPSLYSAFVAQTRSVTSAVPVSAAIPSGALPVSLHDPVLLRQCLRQRCPPWSLPWLIRLIRFLHA